MFESLVRQLAQQLHSPLAFSDVEQEEWTRSAEDPEYFIDSFVKIYDATSKNWIPFVMWDDQRSALQTLVESNKVIWLKARQLGASWEVLAYALWLMLFRPMATVLIFSKRDPEAVELLDIRLKGMHDHLPVWMQQAPVSSAKHGWTMMNGSRALAFPTTGGRSYSGTFAIVDEADFIPDLNKLLNAVQPTVDAGGQLAMVSTVDKEEPLSPFKGIFQGAADGGNGWTRIFHGWRSRPSRTEEWYAERCIDSLSRTGTLDDVYQEYPATIEEALAPISLNKRFQAVWLQMVYEAMVPISTLDAIRLQTPDIVGLHVYRIPRMGESFVIGADPAEGNPTSDDSSLDVVDKLTGEQVAHLAGKFEPKLFGQYITKISQYYNWAPALIERNNHGHAVVRATGCPILLGPDNKPGWLTTQAQKTNLYDSLVETVLAQDCKIRNSITISQLMHINADTLEAPEGMMDDRAMSFALAQAARTRKPASTQQHNYITDPPKDREDAWM